MKLISYKIEIQIAVLKASVQESLKHQLLLAGRSEELKFSAQLS